MSILEVNENWKKASSTQELGALRKSKRHIQVILDEYMEPDQIRRDPRLPRDGSPHPTDVTQYCVNVELNPTSDASRIAWDVVAEYSNELDAIDLQISQGSGSGIPQNPLNDPYTIEYTTGQRMVPLYQDVLTGEPIANTAGDVFDPPFMVPVMEPQLRISRNEASFSYATVQPYVGKLNATAFSGAKAYTVMCTAINASLMYERNVQFWKVTYEFAYREPINLSSTGAEVINTTGTLINDVSPWDAVIPNRGYYYLVDNPVGTVDALGNIIQTKARIKDDNGQDVDVPQFLNADGTLRQAEGTGQKPKPVFINYTAFLGADFNALNLGV